jgi:vacuolar-type H+-ATPase subunit F/Vma7
VSSPRSVGVLGGDPFCRFFTLLGARPFPVADAAGVGKMVREIAGAGETALLLVEEGFAVAAAEALGAEERMTLCPIPGPTGGAGESGAMIDRILTQAIGSHLLES